MARLPRSALLVDGESVEFIYVSITHGGESGSLMTVYAESLEGMNGKHEYRLLALDQDTEVEHTLFYCHGEGIADSSASLTVHDKGLHD